PRRTSSKVSYLAASSKQRLILLPYWSLDIGHLDSGSAAIPLRASHASSHHRPAMRPSPAPSRLFSLSQLGDNSALRLALQNLGRPPLYRPGRTLAPLRHYSPTA